MMHIGLFGLIWNRDHKFNILYPLLLSLLEWLMNTEFLKIESDPQIIELKLFKKKIISHIYNITFQYTKMDMVN